MVPVPCTTLVAAVRIPLVEYIIFCGCTRLRTYFLMHVFLRNREKYWLRLSEEEACMGEEDMLETEGKRCCGRRGKVGVMKKEGDYRGRGR